LNNLIPRVAILLAAYNGIKWIEEQVDTISQQKEVEIDLYISIDISNDGTHKRCKDLTSKNISINILPYGHHFGGAAKNFFRLIRDVDFSDYDYISLADQDDIWLPEKLSRAVKLITDKKLDGYSSDVIAFWADGRERLVKKSYPQKQFDHYFESAGPGCTYVFKRESLQKFKDFLIENWNEVNKVELHDWVIYSYFREKSMSWYIDKVALMRYRQHENNQVGVNNGVQAYWSRLQKINNKWYAHEVQKIVNLTKSHAQDSIVLNKLFLIKNFYHLRRRPRDMIVLLVMIVLGLF
jgi:rhamnosyltransferase